MRATSLGEMEAIGAARPNAWRPTLYVANRCLLRAAALSDVLQLRVAILRVAGKRRTTEGTICGTAQADPFAFCASHEAWLDVPTELQLRLGRRVPPAIRQPSHLAERKLWDCTPSRGRTGMNARCSPSWRRSLNDETLGARAHLQLHLGREPRSARRSLPLQSPRQLAERKVRDCTPSRERTEMCVLRSLAILPSSAPRRAARTARPSPSPPRMRPRSARRSNTHSPPSTVISANLQTGTHIPASRKTRTRPFRVPRRRHRAALHRGAPRQSSPASPARPSTPPGIPRCQRPSRRRPSRRGRSSTSEPHSTPRQLPRAAPPPTGYRPPASPKFERAPPFSHEVIARQHQFGPSAPDSSSGRPATSARAPSTPSHA